LSRKVKISAPAAIGLFPRQIARNAAFETYNILYFDLDMYSSAPIKDMGRRGRPAVTSRVNLGDRNMLGMVARWGHNTLLIGLALMTCVIFFALLK
jgi:hypothetical protein